MTEYNLDLLAKLSRIGELLHRYSHRNHRMHGPAGDPHRGQGRVMALLKMRPEISQKELAYLLDIRPQSLGELLAKLERNGYIERSASEEDRRGMNIRLTEAGVDNQPALFAAFAKAGKHFAEDQAVFGAGGAAPKTTGTFADMAQTLYPEMKKGQV